MENFMYNIHEFMGVDNYEILCENPDYEESNIFFSNKILFGFIYLKLLDSALKYSKKDILKNFHENKDLMDVARYPNGETLGFYNTSEYNLEKISSYSTSEKECNDRLIDYIDGFSENVKVVFEELDFKRVIGFLLKVEMTLLMTYKIDKTPLDEKYFSSYENFMGVFSDFIRLVWKDEIYSLTFDKISNCDPLSSYHYIPKAVDEYGSFLNKLLLIDYDFKNHDLIRIYDPNSSGTYILQKTKDAIGSENIALYGKSVKDELEIIRLAKNSVSKKDSYEINGAEILDINETIFSIPEIDEYADFDLIVSNYIYCEYNEYREIFRAFKTKAQKNTKLVIAVSSVDDIMDDLRGIVENDSLEAIISFKNHHIIICNLNKSKDKINKFLLIEQSQNDEYDDELKKENKQSFDTNFYDGIWEDNWKTLSQRDHEQMDTILDSYKSFNDSIESILINNEDYDEEILKLLLS